MLRTLVAAPVAALLPAAGVNPAEIGTSLAFLARGHGRFFGAAVRYDQLAADHALRTAVLRDCSMLVPEIHLNWTEVQPDQGGWRFGPADALAGFAAEHRLDLRGHTLLWDQGTPDWAKAELADAADWSLIDAHFAGVLGRYAPAIRDWEVVNEPIDSEHGDGGLRRTCFQRAFGPSYIERALRTAHEHAPAARLMINEYGLDYDNPVDEARRTLLLRLVERLRARGVPLHGIGVQAHLDLAKGRPRRAQLGSFLREIGAMGLDVVITELDVKEDDPSQPVELRDARVADAARAYLDIALDVPAVKGIVTWGLSDRHSWLQDQSRGLPPVEAGNWLNRGLPYDAALRRKPMYWAMRDALRHG